MSEGTSFVDTPAPKWKTGATPLENYSHAQLENRGHTLGKLQPRATG